jgi:DNA-binding NtrC family response regulator
MNKKALVIDDDMATLELMRFHLESESFEVVTAGNGKKGLSYVEEEEFDIILTDLNMPGLNGIEMVKRCKEISPETEIIMITGDGSASKAVEATKAGAFYYVEKPIDLEELNLLIEKAIERKKQNAEIKELRGKLTDVDSYEGIIGGSKAMQQIFQMIDSVAESDANILVLGESGTGKEVIANAIHYKSHRAKKSFVKINCAALPKELIESQLFGHVKGSFTGANKDKEGLIAKAIGGSLMLDEIAEMPIELQPKLLRVLQEKTYYRVGSEQSQQADFRLISATNRNPFEAIRDSSLREDLYYRINTIEIHIPPLRERLEDVPMLANHFLKIYSEKYDKKINGFTEGASNQLLNYQWRGNVRELQHVIERSVLLSGKEKIETLQITPYQNSNNPIVSIGSESAQEVERGNLELNAESPEEFFEKIGKIIVDKIPENKAEKGDEKNDVFNALEKGVVSAALKKTDGNKQAAANLLGLYRPRLYGMIKRHSIKTD